MIDDTPKDQDKETDDISKDEDENKEVNNTPKSEDKKEVSRETKIQLLKSILLEVNVFAATVKNLESSLYRKEQETEAAAAEAYLEQKSEDEKQAIPVDEEDKPKIEGEEDEEESTFFSIIKNALGFMIILLPLFFKGFEDIKKMFGELPDIMGGSFKDIVFGLFDKIQGAIEKYVFEPISDYLSNTVSEIWKSLISSIEDTFSGIIGGLPEFLKEQLPDVVKKMIPGSVKDFGEGKPPGTQPDIDTEGSFGATEGASFGGEYNPPKFGTPPTTTSTAAPGATGQGAGPSTGSIPSSGGRSSSVPASPSAATTSSSTTASTTTPAPNAEKATFAPREETSVREEPSSGKRETDTKTGDAVKDKPQSPITGNLSGRAKQLASRLRQMGITNDLAIAAIIATASKESGLNPASKELGAKAWYNTAKKRGIEYLYKVFPQLRPGYRVAKKLGYANGVPLEVFLDYASKGDKAFFDMIYPGEDAGSYVGRGFIQITGKAVYEKIGKLIGVDLVEKPELVAENFDIASSALAAYLSDSVGNGDSKKGLEILNSIQDYDTALKLVIANVASGGFGGDLNKVERAFTEGPLAENKQEQLRKAQGFSEEALAVASTEAEPIPATQGEQIAATTQEVKQVTETAEEKQQQQVIVQTAQAVQPSSGAKQKTEAPVNTKPRIASVQKSYSNYFAVA